MSKVIVDMGVSPDGFVAGPNACKSYENDDQRAPDTRDGPRDCCAQHELPAPGFPADR